MLASTFSLLPALQLNLLESSSPSCPQPLLPWKRRKWSKGRSRKLLATRCCSCESYQLSTQSDEPTNYSKSWHNPDENSSRPRRRLLYPGVLSDAIKSCSNIREVKRIHAAVLRISQNLEVFAGNNLVSAYVKFTRIEDARKLFDTMLERNVVSWTALLNGYSKMGFEEEFLELYNEMIDSCVEANSLTFVCLLNFCGKSLNFELGRQVHASVLKGKWRNLILDSALVYFYSQLGDVSAAFRIFDRMKKSDVICWTTMITTCAQHGRGDEAMLIFSQMQESGFSPNEFTVCSVLKACGEEKALKFGRQLHCVVVKGMFKNDVYVSSSLVGMYMRCGEVEDARAVFDLMPNRNTVTWTALIAGYAQNGFGEEALLWFQRMKRRRIFANNLTAVSILTACGTIGSLLHGKEVHGQILKNNIQNNAHIGSTLVWFYCKCGEYTYATRVLEVMPVRDVISWTAIISGCAYLGHNAEALLLLNKMMCEGVEPNPFTYSAALKACSRLDDVMQGRWIHASVSKTCSLANIFVASALISLYMKCGCVEDASRVFEIMPDRNSVSWKAMIIGYAKNGLCEEALKLLYRMQAEGFEVDDYIVSTVLTSCGDIHWEAESNSMCLLTN